jgi:hypothetical protein
LIEETSVLPAGLDWNDLAAEMKANIRLGLTAGEIAGGEQEVAPSHAWRAAVVLASVLMLAATVLWWYQRTYRPEPGMAAGGGPIGLISGSMPADDIILRTTLGGIGVESSGQALALAAEEEDAPRGITVSLQGSMNARYVDEDGDEVTIHRVYAE